jgi:hypothetical protein
LKTGVGGGNAQPSSTGGNAGHIILQPGNGGSAPTLGAGGSTFIRASNSGDILSVQNSAGSTTHLAVNNSGNVRIGTASSEALLQLGAGTASLPPLKLTAGTNLTTPAAGALEWDGTQLQITPTSPTKRRPLAFGDTAGASSPANHYSTGEFSWNYSPAFNPSQPPISGSMTHGLAIGDPRVVFRPEGVYNVATIAQAQANSTLIENIKAAMPDTGGIIELRDEYFVYGTVRNLERPYGPVSAIINGASNNGSGLIRISTSQPHGLFTGYKVTIASVGGVTNANGTWVVTYESDTTFDLQGSTFAGNYTGGGTITLHRTIPFGILAALARPLAKGVVLGQIPVAVRIGDHHRLKERNRRLAKPLIADRQRQALLNLQIHLPTHQQEPGARIEHLRQSSLGAKDQSIRARQHVTRQRAHSFPRVNPANNSRRAGMRAQPFDGLGLERSIRVDPQRLVEALGQRGGGHVVARLVDRGVAIHATHRVAAVRQLHKRRLARRLDVRGDGDKNNTS